MTTSEVWHRLVIPEFCLYADLAFDDGGQPSHGGAGSQWEAEDSDTRRDCVLYERTSLTWNGSELSVWALVERTPSSLDSCPRITELFTFHAIATNIKS